MLRSLLIGACALLVVAGTASVYADDSFIVLPETQSPDGRFAIGWGLPKHPEIWKKVRESREEQAEALIVDVGAFEEDVENYVVDLRATKVLGKLRSHYWHVGEVRPNRHHLDVVWSANSDLVLVNHTYRWDCRAFEAVSINEGRAGARLDLKKTLDTKLRRHFKQALPRGSGISVSALAISFSELAVISGETFKATAEAEFPTKSDNAWSGQAEIRFAITPSKASGIALKVLSLK